MKRLRAGIIGLGVGERHIDVYRSHPDCEIAAICDFSDEKLREAAEKYPGIKLTGKAEDVLTDPEIDIVSIASYDNYHYEQVVQAIDNNKHIFVEKPLCQYRNQAIEIRRLLQTRPDLKMSSNLVLRLVPRFRELRQMIADGKFGQLFYAEGDYNYGRLYKITDGWRGKIDYYSVVQGGGVHIIDLLQWLTGDRVVEVGAFGNNLSSGGSFRYNDTVAAIMKFQSGMVAKVTCNFACVAPHFHGLNIYGTRATFINERETGILIESRDPAQPARKITSAYPAPDKSGTIYSFIEDVLGRSQSEVSTESIFEVMSVCFAIEDAIQCSSTIVVEYI
jgi:predicted dehydrogenase